MKKIEVIHENENLIAVNKPTGLVVHADGKTDEPNLSEWFEENYPESRQVGEPLTLSDGRVIARAGVVHRLDRETSGVLLLAKTQESFLHLKTQFQTREVRKTYNTFVYGKFKEERGSVARAIGRSPSDFRRFSAERGARGKLREAQTDYLVLKTAYVNEQPISFLEVSPLTGRTHQIRVHLKSISRPVLCDTLYAPKQACLLGFDRLALHARSISFKDLDGKELTLEADLPPDFVSALENLETEEVY